MTQAAHYNTTRADMPKEPGAVRMLVPLHALDVFGADEGELADPATVARFRHAIARGDRVPPAVVLSWGGALSVVHGVAYALAADELGLSNLDAVVFTPASASEADAVSAVLFELGSDGFPGFGAYIRLMS